MPEATVKLSIEVPKAFVQQALHRKPKWLSATDEGYLGKMFAAGNFDEFFKNYEGINDKLSEVQKGVLRSRQGNIPESGITNRSTTYNPTSPEKEIKGRYQGNGSPGQFGALNPSIKSL